MTEDEAKTKWCPQVQFYPPSENSGWESNRPTGIVTSFCIASSCMAWRWWIPPKNESAGDGYCGLAGKP